MSKAILVTGAAGFAGSHLLDLLVQSDDASTNRLVAWCRPGGRAPRAIDCVDWDAVDLLDRSAMLRSLQQYRPDVVYHLAGAPHVGRAWEATTTALAVNVRATHNLIESLREAALSPVLFVASSATVYRPADRPIVESFELLPPNPYGFTKLAQERLAMRSLVDGIDVRVARPFNHIGPRQEPAYAASAFARQIAEIEAGRRSADIVVGNLAARRDITDVRDTVRAYRAIVERGMPGCCYNVSSGRAYAVRDLLDRLVAAARVPVNIRVDPALFRPNDTPLLVGDPTRIREDLGWTPAIALDESLHDVLEYWRGEVQ